MNKVYFDVAERFIQFPFFVSNVASTNTTTPLPSEGHHIHRFSSIPRIPASSRRTRDHTDCESGDSTPHGHLETAPHPINTDNASN